MLVVYLHHAEIVSGEENQSRHETGTLLKNTEEGGTEQGAHPLKVCPQRTPNMHPIQTDRGGPVVRTLQGNKEAENMRDFPPSTCLQCLHPGPG